MKSVQFWFYVGKIDWCWRWLQWIGVADFLPCFAAYVRHIPGRKLDMGSGAASADGYTMLPDGYRIFPYERAADPDFCWRNNPRAQKPHQQMERYNAADMTISP